MLFEDARRRAAARLYRHKRASRPQSARQLDDLAHRRAQGNLVVAGPLHVSRDGNDLIAFAALRTDRREPVGAAFENRHEIGERLDVVDDRRHAVEPLDRRKRRLQPRLAALALERVEQRRLLAADIRAGAAMNGDLEIVTAAEDVLADVSGLARFVERRAENLVAALELAANVDERVMRGDPIRPDQHALDNQMRRVLEQHVIFERAGLGFVAVADEVAHGLVLRQKRPFLAGRKTRAAAAAQTRLLADVEHVRRLQLAHRALPLPVAAALPVRVDAAHVDLADPGGQDLSDRHARLLVDRLHDRARIDHRSLRRSPENCYVAADDVVEHDDAARVADAAGVVRARDVARAGRLSAARDLRVLRNLPRARRHLGLRHRRRHVRARPHRRDHLVDLLRRQIVHELEVHFHTRRAVARRQTLDFLVGEKPVVRRLQMADAQLLAQVCHDVFGAVDRARQARDRPAAYTFRPGAGRAAYRMKPRPQPRPASCRASRPSRASPPG